MSGLLLGAGDRVELNEHVLLPSRGGTDLLKGHESSMCKGPVAGGSRKEDHVIGAGAGELAQACPAEPGWPLQDPHLSLALQSMELVRISFLTPKGLLPLAS